MTRRELGSAAVLAALALVYAALLAVYRWLPAPGILSVTAATIDALVLLGLIWAASSSDRFGNAALIALAVLSSVLVLFGLGEGFYQTIFRQPFVPWTDLAFLPALLNMVFETEAFARPVLVAVPMVVLVGIVTALLYLLIRALSDRIRSAGRPALILAATAVLILSAAHGVLVITSSSAGDGSRAPLTVRLIRQLSPPVADVPDPPPGPSRVALEQRARQARYAFPQIRDRDIHLFIVESYGHTLQSNPEHQQLVAPMYARLERQLRDAGYHSYTGFLVSPAFGGRSWLADASMLTGVFIDTQHEYDAMVDAGAQNLTHILGDAGYHRVMAAPGTYEANDAWRQLYEFDQYLFRYDFGYMGPFVSFGAMPDQFLIYRANQLAQPGDKPLFLNYVLVSTHVPFERLPVYLPDWNDLGDGSIFNDLPIRTFDNNWLTGGEYPLGYVTSIDYTLTAVVDYLSAMEDSPLVIIVGDHQPRIPVSEPESSFSVPIHILSRDRESVEPFAHYGFSRGFTPGQWLSRHPEAHRGMDELKEMLLDAARGITSFYGQIER